MNSEYLKSYLANYFDLTALKVEELNGYDNKNFRIQTEQGVQFIVKTYTDTNLITLLEEESRILSELQLTIDLPVPRKSRNEQWVERIDDTHFKGLIRVLTYVAGSFLADTSPSLQTANSIGQQTAFLHQKLSTIQSGIISQRHWNWHLNASKLLKSKMHFIVDLEVRRAVHYFIQCFEQYVLTQKEDLPSGLIHNDLNEYNLLADTQGLTGIIDFGDIAYAPRIYDLAIAMVYIAYDKKDYLSWSAALLKGYFDKAPLSQLELELLYYVMAMRLCASLCNSAEAKVTQPENEYAGVSEDRAIKMLLSWLEIGPIKAFEHYTNATSSASSSSLSANEKLEERHKFLSKSLSVSYEQPLYLKRAALQYMYDHKGTTFLDAYNNIPHVGHNHPKVVEAAQKQLLKLNTNTRYLYDELAAYAQDLLSYFPPRLNKVFFVNSGSEASDLAIRIARFCSDKKGIAVVEHGYHGHTQTGIEISDYKFNHPKGIGQADHIVKLPLLAEQDRPHFSNRWPEIQKQLKQSTDLAAFISESILGCAGQVPLLDGYLPNIYEQIRKGGGYCIADEVQTGFGRVGTHFWAFQQQNVIPDMVVIGKPMGNGHPMGAVVCTAELADTFSEGVEFFSSFGGNPVSCVIGKAVLEVIAEEDLQQQALYNGNYYLKCLDELKQIHRSIHEIRGSGLFVGVDLRDASGKEDTKAAHFTKNFLRNKGVLISTDGPLNNVLKSKPPMCFTKENIDRVISILDLALREYQK
jgi:ethanolamine-phosphate phospho-lyase